MIQKKICMIGAFSVGKTSLVGRFVHSIFSERYQTTVGVKIDKKEINSSGQSVTLVLWDMAGDDPFQELPLSYLRGAAGYFMVADGTRKATLEKIVTLRQEIIKNIGDLPMLLVLNKADLKNQWEIDLEYVDELKNSGLTIIEGSAKTGLGVERAFATLAEKTIQKNPSL